MRWKRACRQILCDCLLKSESMPQPLSGVLNRLRPSLGVDMVPLLNDYPRTPTRVKLDVFLSRTGGSLC